MSDTEHEATLSSVGDLTVFTFGGHEIRFKTSPHLERYLRVTEWDNGYIVCMAKYDNAYQPEEEYIDLIPVLKNLYYDPEQFLKPIKSVRVCYD